jgi:hypothetical protein
MVGIDSDDGRKIGQLVSENNVEPYEFTFSNHSEKVMKAIEASVHKWEDVILGKTKERGQYNCPLCNLFFPDCVGMKCPIAEKTKESSCNRTPYRKWINVAEYNNGYFVSSFESYKTALNEIEFLKNLLSKYKEELEVCQL